MIRHEGASIVFNSDEVQTVVIVGQGKFGLLVKGNMNPITFASIGDFKYNDANDGSIIESIMYTMQKFISSPDEIVINLREAFEESFNELFRPWKLKESDTTDEGLKEQWQNTKTAIDNAKESLINNDDN